MNISETGISLVWCDSKTKTIESLMDYIYDGYQNDLRETEISVSIVCTHL